MHPVSLLLQLEVLRGKMVLLLACHGIDGSWIIFGPILGVKALSAHASIKELSNAMAALRYHVVFVVVMVVVVVVVAVVDGQKLWLHDGY